MRSRFSSSPRRSPYRRKARQEHPTVRLTGQMATAKLAGPGHAESHPQIPPSEEWRSLCLVPCFPASQGGHLWNNSSMKYWAAGLICSFGEYFASISKALNISL